ncbi:MAG TPA: lipid A-modifier LpxR family protein [Bacteroidia bacterium]|jgi:lipid A 3-O-deacylase|nr:lipid A-modifier LpxR family protein [Bacteroidia bacterium]
MNSLVDVLYHVYFKKSSVLCWQYKLLIFVFFALCSNSLHAQENKPAYMLRAYEDNDCFNTLGGWTDRAYTAGQQCNFYYNIKPNPKFFLARWFPKAGDSSVNTCSLGLMQIIYTPQDLRTSYYSPNDYPYSGAFVGEYSVYSYNPERKYDLQTELILGAMGPITLSGNCQIWLHSLLHAPIPMGWDNQLRNAPLLNINSSFEKGIYCRKYVEVIGNGQLFAGIMQDELGVGASLLMGEMDSYFDGFMSHYNGLSSKNKKALRKVQLYFTISAGAQYVLYNAILQGGLFAPAPNVKVNVSNQEGTVEYIRKPYQPIKYS